MHGYSEWIDRVLREEDLLTKLHPTDVFDHALVRTLRTASDATLVGTNVVADATMLPVIRGGLFYALDSLPDAHPLFQDAATDLGSYWHGMLHRREADFDNARYWFRRAGTLPFFNAMQQTASEFSLDMAKQSNWDPYLFTGQCEQARFGATELVPELLKLQRVEFDGLFDYCWRRSVRRA